MTDASKQPETTKPKAEHEAKYLYGIEAGKFKGEVWREGRKTPQIVIMCTDPEYKPVNKVDFTINPTDADLVVSIIKNLHLWIETNAQGA